MDSRIEAIRQRMIEAGIDSDEVEMLIKPLVSELERRVCGLVWKHEGATSRLLKDMEGKIPVITPVRSKNIIQNNDGTNHILIEGENLLTLMAMQYTHIGEKREGLVDIIYIDPPYNTETTTMDYNDKYEKSEWLSMMNVRLKLANSLLSEKGVIFVSIDDKYQAELKLLMDDIYGVKNHVATFVWEKKKKGSFLSGDKTNIKEYIITYSKNYRSFDGLIGEINNKKETYPCVNASNKRSVRKIRRGIECKFKKKNFNLPAGTVVSNKTMNIVYLTGLVVKDGVVDEDFLVEGNWRYAEELMEEYMNKGELYITNKLYLRRIVSTPRMKAIKDILPKIGTDPNLKYSSPIDINNLYVDGWGTNEDADDEIIGLFGTDRGFSYPKPTKLIEKLLLLPRMKNAIVLDFYAGSGTTLQAVLELNQIDKGHRQAIICTNNELGEKAVDRAKKDGVTPEMAGWEEYGVCHAVTYPRLKTVFSGVRIDGSKYSNGYKDNNLYYYKVSDGITESPISKITKDALTKQAVSYIAFKENIHNVDEYKDYHVLSNKDSEVMVVTDPSKNYLDVHDEYSVKIFSKEKRKVYCSLANRTVIEGIEYVPYPNEVLDVLKSVKRRVKKEANK